MRPLWLVIVAVQIAAAGAAMAQLPEFDAPIVLRGATIVVSPGETIEGGAVLIREGRIAAVGRDVELPPAARVIDVTGMYVYAGWIDALCRAGVSDPALTAADERRAEGEFPSPSEGPLVSTVDANRAGIFASRRAAELVDIEEDTFNNMRQAGFAAAMVAPPRAIVAGRAGVLELGTRPLRESLLRDDVFMVLSFEVPRRRELSLRGRYPSTQFGLVAHLRQFLLDAEWLEEMKAYAARHPDAVARVPVDANLEAIRAVRGGSQRVLWEADTVEEIERALKIADEFELKIALAGGREAWQVAELLARREIPVVLSANLPRKPREYKPPAEGLTRVAAGDLAAYGKDWGSRPFLPKSAFDEAAEQRKRAVSAAATLEAAGVRWCLTTSGLERPSELLTNLQEMIEAGLSADAALRALTRTPAELIGVQDRLGAVRAGALANLTVLTAPLEKKDAKVRWVFVGGEDFEFAVSSGGGGRDRDARRGGPRGRRGERPARMTEEQRDEPPQESDEPEEQAEERESDEPAPEGEEPGEQAASKPATGPAAASQPARELPTDLVMHEPDWPIERYEDRRAALKTGGTVLLTNARIFTMAGRTLEHGSILIRDGKIEAVAPELEAPDGVTTIDLSGCSVIPGIIDPHSHIAIQSTNEASRSITPEVRCEDVIEADDVSIWRALAGGVTTIHVMHGSANPIGGQCAQIKLKYGRPAAELLIPDQVRTVKWALGENVVRPGKGGGFRGRTDTARRFPGTRMGVEAALRRALTAGREYGRARRAAIEASAAGQDVEPLRHDLRLAALADMLEGEIWINTHCYRADEVLRLMHVAEEFGVRIATLHHILEGYRIMPEIARHGAGTATFADWWAYKVEAYDAVPHNAAMLLRAGVNSTIKSDSADLMRHLTMEAAKCAKYGGLSDSEALGLITINAARLFGLDQRLGSIEPGKDGDLAVFDGHPLDSFARCVLTMIEGEVYFQHASFDPSAGERTVRQFAPPAAGRPWIPHDTPPPADTYAIVGGIVHTISNGTIEGGTVVIQDGRIAAVGRDVPVPAGAERIEAHGRHVYPGLINAATQVGLAEVESIDVTIDIREPGSYQSDLMAVSAVNPHSAMIDVVRAEGITTALIVPDGPVVPGRAGLVNLHGWTLDEMLIDPAVALVVNLPTTRAEGIMPPERGQRRGPPGPQERGSAEDEGGDQSSEAVRRLVRFVEDARLYADAVDAARAGMNTPLPPADPRFDAMRPFVRGERPVLIRASSYQAILEALLFAERVGVRPVILGGRDAWKLASLLKQRDVPVIYEGVFAQPSRIAGLDNVHEPWDANYRALAVLENAGVRFAACYSGADLAKLLPTDVGFAVAHGLSPDAALRAMTLSAAEILGVQRELGSLEPGKIANVVISTRHPCQTTNVVEAVFVEGRPASLMSKHSRQAEQFLNRPAPALPPPAETLAGPPSQSRATQRTASGSGAR